VCGVNREVTDEQISAIPGWFSSIDIDVSRFFHNEQVRRGETGDLAELGVYLGASAVLLGSFVRSDETFTVVDLFEDPATDEANARENRAFYSSLTQKRFEDNYLAAHGELPVVVRGHSTRIRKFARPGNHRLVHIDASHAYDNVVQDIATAKLLLAPGGIVVFDDYRTDHTPGVAAAVWPTLRDGLIPLVATPSKLYGTWGDGAGWPTALDSWLASHPRIKSSMHDIAGHRLARVWRNERPQLNGWIPPVLLPLAGRIKRTLLARR
jgi:hypothetical protein